MYIDTHCHLSKEYYDDINKVIEENKLNNIDKMIVSGCEKNSIREVIDIINKYDLVYATIGYHPDQINIVTDKDIEDLEEVIKSNQKIVGIGEIGLDYHYDSNNKTAQKKLFEKQLKLAEKLSLRNNSLFFR